MVNDPGPSGGGLFGTHSNYLFERYAGERERLERQFGLFRDDFNFWFDECVRLGGRSTAPGEATWSALDLGCGEGQFAIEIARRYPRSRVTGMDVDAAAIENATAGGASLANVSFEVHDARERLPAGSRFDVAVMWLVLLYLPDKAAALANAAAALGPDGTLLLCNSPSVPARYSHPVAEELMAATNELARAVGAVGFEDNLGVLLEGAGFCDVASVELRYPLGGATTWGRRWWAHLLTVLSAMRPAVVDVGHLMDGDAFDRRIDILAEDSPLERSGDWRFLVTVARRAS